MYSLSEFYYYNQFNNRGDELEKYCKSEGISSIFIRSQKSRRDRKKK